MNVTILRRAGLAILALCVLLAAGIGYTSHRDAEQFAAEMGASQGGQRLAELAGDLQHALRDAESNQRSLLLTRRESYRPLYASAVDRSGKDVAQMEGAPQPPGKHRDAVRELAGLARLKLAQLQQGLEARKRMAPAATGEGDKGLNERIAALCAQIAASATGHPEDVPGRLSAYARETGLATLLGCLMLTVLLGGAMYAVQLAFRQQDLAQQSLEHAAEQIRQVRDLWHNTLRSMGDAVVVTNAEGDIAFSNEMAHTLSGWSREAAEQASAESVFRIVDADTRQPVENPVTQVLRSEPVAGLGPRSLLLRPDSSGVAIDASCAPLRDKEEKLLGAVLVFRDITARRKTELEAEEVVRRYQTLLDSVGDGFIALDETFRFVYANSKAAALLGLGTEDLRGRVLWGEIPGLSNSPLGKSLIRAMRDELPLETEEEHKGVRLAIRAYPSSKGLTLYLADVTAHRALKGEAGERPEDRVQRGLRAAGAATWEYDVTARRMHWSDAAKDLFGGSEAACPATLLQQMLKGPGADFRLELQGEERWLSWMGQAVRTADGERRIAGILIDVTAQQQARGVAARA